MIGTLLRIAGGYLGEPQEVEPLEFEQVPYPKRMLQGKTLRLCCVGAGDAPGAPIVFLHPGSADLTAFAPQMAAPSDQRRVIALDLPGHGKSDRLSEPLTIEGLMFYRPCLASGVLVDKMLRLKSGSGYDQAVPGDDHAQRAALGRAQPPAQNRMPHADSLGPQRQNAARGPGPGF
ncbi:MAG: hypothetical protein P9M14_10075 [Candidatus Alcyoniella australis]|nr:hypothetical protein [Candidatus Alcyoniella australis]